VIAEHTAWWWIRQISQILWFITLALVFWSGIKPFGKFSTKWYDRAIRAIGAGIILAMLLFGLVLYLRG
jgi:hypothetical protein